MMSDAIFGPEATTYHQVTAITFISTSLILLMMNSEVKGSYRLTRMPAHASVDSPRTQPCAQRRHCYPRRDRGDCVDAGSKNRSESIDHHPLEWRKKYTITAARAQPHKADDSFR